MFLYIVSYFKIPSLSKCYKYIIDLNFFKESPIFFSYSYRLAFNCYLFEMFVGFCFLFPVGFFFFFGNYLSKQIIFIFSSGISNLRIILKMSSLPPELKYHFFHILYITKNKFCSDLVVPIFTNLFICHVMFMFI